MTDFRCDLSVTEHRLARLDAYFRENVFADGQFTCRQYGACSGSHDGTFIQGQLHHVGRYYDLTRNDKPFRIAIVGQEYGGGNPFTTLEQRTGEILKSAFKHRFKAVSGQYKARNPHMRGTTNVLRLLFDAGLGDDFESEHIDLGDSLRPHIFETFALTNYLLCSAVYKASRTRGARPIPCARIAGNTSRLRSGSCLLR